LHGYFRRACVILRRISLDQGMDLPVLETVVVIAMICMPLTLSILFPRQSGSRTA
jgi:hypothetical protein